MNTQIRTSMRDRIELKRKIKSSDIKHKGLLTTDEIQDLPIKTVYEWVKTGKWSLTDFNTWLRALRVI